MALLPGYPSCSKEGIGLVKLSLIGQTQVRPVRLDLSHQKTITVSRARPTFLLDHLAYRIKLNGLQETGYRDGTVQGLKFVVVTIIVWIGHSIVPPVAWSMEDTTKFYNLLITIYKVAEEICSWQLTQMVHTTSPSGTYEQGRRQGCSIGVAFGGCGNINVWIVCVHVPADICIPRKLAFLKVLYHAKVPLGWDWCGPSHSATAWLSLCLLAIWTQLAYNWRSWDYPLGEMLSP